MKDDLLIRAAQANGHAYPWTMPNGFGDRPWNPLTNNEDALVLAVRIGLQVTAYPMYDEPKHSVIVRKPVWDHDAQEGDGVEVVEPYGTDALAATRRAITMCAAELARRKTPNRKGNRVTPDERTDMHTTDAGGTPVDRPVVRHPLDVVCLYSDDCKTLMSKGHHEPDAFLAAVQEWNGGPLEGRWGKVRHGWHRTVPDSTGEYRCLMHPAKPHARGAYPTTCIVDDADYDIYP